MIENDSELFKVDVENYNGPLDVLLDLAKAQKVNLEDISITKLADQFHDFITQEKKLNLEIASEYLLMATWLAYLKSKLLLPGTPEEEFKVPLQCKAKLQPALNVLIVFSFKLPLRLFMDKSSEIKIFLKPILLRINLINFFE